MKKNLIKVAFVAAFAMIAGNIIFNAAALNVEADAASDIGCINRPGHNTGDCVDDGSSYFCENSWIFHDCVKGESIL